MRDDEGGAPLEPDDATDEGESSPPSELPASPYSTEPVEYMVEDEVLAVRLRGATIGGHSLPTAIAGPFMFRLHELVHAIVARIAGREGGQRGPLPRIDEAGLLAFAGFEGGASVTFHFEIGPGEVFRIDPNETSVTQRALDMVADLVELTASQDDEGLIGHARDLGQRAGTDYLLLVRLLAQHHVTSLWRVSPASSTVPAVVRVTVADAHRAELILDAEGDPKVTERVVRGWLYDTNAKKREFLVEPVDLDVDKLTGTYGPELREQLRNAWDREVVIRVLVTEKFLRRQAEPAETTVELLEVLDVIAEDEGE